EYRAPVRRPLRARSDARWPGGRPVRGPAVPGRAARLGLMPAPLARVAFHPAYRIVPSRFPPVGVFDAIADPADYDALYELESLTNPRLREQLGPIRLVPAHRPLGGPVP